MEPGGAGAPLSAWVLTDGKAGDEDQGLAVTEAIGCEAEIRRVRPGPLFAALAPWGPPDPAEAADKAGSPIAPPWPDLLVASGRRAVPYLRAVRKLSGGRTFTVFLKDPRTGAGTADLIWAPEHDGLRGANVVATLTAPHRFSAARLAAARRDPDPRVAALGRPLVGVLIGGDSRHHRFETGDVERLIDGLSAVAGGAALAITASRRTPAALAEQLRGLAERTGAFLWDGTGPNPYPSILACADAIVATADSTNMVGEAAATGAPVHVFAPSGGHRKIAAYLDALATHGAVRPFAGRVEAWTYTPLDATPAVAEAVLRGLERRRAAAVRA